MGATAVPINPTDTTQPLTVTVHIGSCSCHVSCNECDGNSGEDIKCTSCFGLATFNQSQGLTTGTCTCEHASDQIDRKSCACPVESEEFNNDGTISCVCNNQHFVATAGVCGCPKINQEDYVEQMIIMENDDGTCTCFDERAVYSLYTGPYCTCPENYSLIAGVCQMNHCPLTSTDGSCPDSWVGDNVCDAECNFAACVNTNGLGYDGGACPS